MGRTLCDCCSARLAKSTADIVRQRSRPCQIDYCCFPRQVESDVDRWRLTTSTRVLTKLSTICKRPIFAPDAVYCNRGIKTLRMQRKINQQTRIARRRLHYTIAADLNDHPALCEILNTYGQRRYGHTTKIANNPNRRVSLSRRGDLPS